MRTVLASLLVLTATVARAADTTAQPITPLTAVPWPIAGADRETCLTLLADPYAAYALLTPHLSDAERVRIGHKLLTELRWLGGKVATSPEVSGRVPDAKLDFPSLRFFDTQRQEYDRTVAGLLALANVLAGSREGLLNPDMPPAAQIQPATFEELRQRTLRVLTTPERVAAMQATLTVADLGKSEPFANVLHGIGVSHDLDHDQLLARGVAKEPLVIESYARLAPAERNLMLKAISTDYNVAQFVQGENVAANIEALRGLTKEEFDFYFLHFVYDVAGAQGDKDPRGAKALVDPVYKLFAQGADVLWEGLSTGLTNGQIYDRFLKLRGEGFGWDPHRSPRERALIRLALISRTKPSDGPLLVEVFDALPAVDRDILLRELMLSGEHVGDGMATRLYYSPAIVANAVTYYREAKTPDFFKKALQVTLPVLARLHQLAFQAKAGRDQAGVFTLDAYAVSVVAGTNPEGLASMDFVRGPSDKVVVRTHVPTVRVNELRKMRSLAELGEGKLVFVGIGGGSDGIQAAILADLARRAGREVAGVISVRNVISGSQGPGGGQFVEWKLENATEHVPGVYQITPDTNETGGARFLENLPAALFPMRLVLDNERKHWGDLATQLEIALRRTASDIGTVVLVDTGGDALTPVKSRPGQPPEFDRDVRVMFAMWTRWIQLQTPWKLRTAIVAPGIDAPENATSLLIEGKATSYRFTETDRDVILGHYGAWGMDADAASFVPTRIGLTPLALQAALRGRRGYRTLPVPLRLVSDRRNPWMPHRSIDESLNGVVVLDTERLLEVIGAVVTDRNR